VWEFFKKIKNKWKYVYKATVGISCSRVVTKLVGITFLVYFVKKIEYCTSVLDLL
jgi:hypothetical protein